MSNFEVSGAAAESFHRPGRRGAIGEARGHVGAAQPHNHRGRLLALLLLSLSGCKGGPGIENLVARVSWFSNMRDQPSVEAFEEAPRPMPEGTQPIGDGVPLMGRPDDYADIANPIEVSDSSLARGQVLFDRFCAVCHGPQGRGGGNVEGPFPAGLIPHLDTPRARGYTDGYVFGMMAAGRGLMPNYRRIPQHDRWDVVNYLRQLQALTAPDTAGGG
jgi:mono/diheme cytochrome c family protein